MNGRMLTLALGLMSCVSTSPVAAQTIVDRLNSTAPPTGAPLVIGILGEPVRLSIEELTKKSDLVVEGTLSVIETYVNKADTAVVTDCQVTPLGALAGTAPVSPIVMSTVGGEVVRAGVTIRQETYGRDALHENTVYLIFLKKFGSDPGVYQPYNDGAFERAGGVTRPLATRGNDTYPDFARPYTDVVSRVIDAALVR
jgi:hypothetical protein